MCMWRGRGGGGNPITPVACALRLAGTVSLPSLALHLLYPCIPQCTNLNFPAWFSCLSSKKSFAVMGVLNMTVLKGVV